jgi:hypothetical protein
MMHEARTYSQPDELGHGEWHLPLVDDVEELMDDYVNRVPPGFQLDPGLQHFTKFLILVCVGRCARVSYLTHNGERDPHADVELAMRLLSNGHMSPFEHAATPLTQEDADLIISKSLRANVMLPYLADPTKTFCGNFRGWKSYRKMIPGEDNFKARDTMST